MNGGYKVEVTHDDSGRVVKTIECKNDRDAEKVYQGLLINMNLGEYTANIIEPPIQD